MADTVTVGNTTGQPNDYIVAADDCGATGKVQLVKLAIGLDGFGNLVAADENGLFVQKVPAFVSTVTSVAGSASNTTILSQNTGRYGATIYNDSTARLRLKLGATASASSFTAILEPNGYYEVPFNYCGIIDGIWESGTGNARCTEIEI